MHYYVFSPPGVEMNATLCIQKKAQCGHYMPSFDSHNTCVQCRIADGQNCKETGPKCDICRPWAKEYWAFINSVYPNCEEDNYKKCENCSASIPVTNKSSKCLKCEKKRKLSQSSTSNKRLKSKSIDQSLNER